MATNGNLIFFKRSGVKFGGQTNSTLNAVRAMIETSNKDTGIYASFIPGRIKTTLKVDAKFSATDTYSAHDAWNDFCTGTAWTMTFGGNSSGDPLWSFTGYFSSYDVVAQDEADTTIALGIQVTGTPTLATYS